MNTRINRTAGLLLLFVPTLMRGQFSFSGSFSTMFDDNIENNALQVYDKISRLSWEGGYLWDAERFQTRVAYEGELHYYGIDAARSFHVHEVSLTHSGQVDDDAHLLYEAGASYGQRFGRELFSFYDHRIATGTAGISWTPAEFLRLKLGYTFRATSFREVPEYDYTEHVGALRATIALPSRTTLIAGGEAGVKTLTPTVMTVESGSGNGRRFGNTETTVTLPGPATTQITGSLRVGQSVFDGTGVSLTGMYRVNTGTASTTPSPEGTSDDDIFEDHYAYEGPSLSLMITQIIGSRVTVRFIVDRQNRTYADRPVYENDLLLFSGRADTRQSATLLADYAIVPGGLTLSVIYDYIRNSSNDPLYTYGNNALTLGIHLPL